MPEPDCFLRYRMRCNAEFYYVGKNPAYRYWAPVAAARRGFKMVLFTASHENNFVGGKCIPPNAFVNKHGQLTTTFNEQPITVADSALIGYGFA